ncbi:ATPase [Vibrio mimicus]
MDFVLDVNQREPKTKYIVMYRPEQGEFIDQFVLRMKTKGIAKYRYKLEAAPETQSKAVSILATYIQITSQDCGTLTFHNANDYPFGCSVEHNRGISLVNPLEE